MIINIENIQYIHKYTHLLPYIHEFMRYHQMSTASYIQGARRASPSRNTCWVSGVVSLSNVHKQSHLRSTNTQNIAQLPRPVHSAAVSAQRIAIRTKDCLRDNHRATLNICHCRREQIIYLKICVSQFSIRAQDIILRKITVQIFHKLKIKATCADEQSTKAKNHRRQSHPLPLRQSGSATPKMEAGRFARVHVPYLVGLHGHRARSIMLLAYILLDKHLCSDENRLLISDTMILIVRRSVGNNASTKKTKPRPAAIGA